MKWFSYQMKLIPLNPVGPATVFLFSLLDAHQLVIFPGHYSLTGKKSCFKISLNIHLPKIKHQLLKDTNLVVIMFSPLAWHDLLSSPLVSSANSSPILNDTS